MLSPRPSDIQLRSLLSLLVLCAPLAACGDDDDGPPSTEPDASMVSTDAGPPDAPTVDSGPPVPAEFDPAPAFRHPVDTADAELAQQALRILGAPEAGGSESCGACHGLTRNTIRRWHTMSDFAWGTCFTDLEVRTAASAQRIVECLRNGATTDDYDADTVGVFAAAARLEWYPVVFERALGEGGAASYAEFVDGAGMPAGDHEPLSQADFDVVAEWFIRGVPGLDMILPADPRPTECEESITPALTAHVREMALSGWAARNLENELPMYGCAGAESPAQCLASKTRVAEWEVEGSTLRELYAYANRSSYWTRSSADGRYVGHGGGAAGPSTIIDLQEDHVIGVQASYDPGFFPDNSGFVFHQARGGARFCEQSLLSSTPERVTLTEPGCRANGSVGLYEHVGATLGGSDYWAIDGVFTNDDGGRPGDADPEASFSGNSVIDLTRLVHDGSVFRSASTSRVATPYEGDPIISPSSRLIVSRTGSASGVQLGYVIRLVDVVRNESGAVTSVTAPEVGRICTKGGKPSISYDERWMVIHHYEDDSSNVWLVDLLTGESTQVTAMPSGYFALYPHFRSDGWIYFIVRGPEGTGERVIASDAALVAPR